jgi:proteasome lid subunit RPN8/RPN11
MSGAVWLHPAHADALLAHAQADAPHEACGLLFGRGSAIEAVVPVANTATDPTHRFELDQRAFIRNVFAAEKRGMALVGFYHSHPTGLALPSQTDIDQCHYPDAVQIIIGLRSQPPVTAWRLAYGSAEALTLHIVDTMPPAEAMQPLHTQGVSPVVILSALIAVILLLLLSFALLPPAPRLPAP